MAGQAFEQFFAGNWQESKQALEQLLVFEFASVLDKEKIEDLKKYAAYLLENSEFALDDSWQKINQEFLLLFDKRLIDEFSKTELRNQNALVLKLYDHLKLLCVAAGGLSDFEMYAPEEIKNIFSQAGTNYDKFRFLYTCRQIALGFDREKYLDVLIPFMFLDEVLGRKEFNYEDILTYSVLIKVLWSNFAFMIDSDKEASLQNYFYKAIVIGVPVSAVLEDYLYTNSFNQMTYLEEHIELIKILEENKEDILVFQYNKFSYKSLMSIIQMYETKVGKAHVIDGFAQQQFLNEFYQTLRGKDKYTGWILEVFRIFFHIRKVDLVEIPAYEERNEFKEYSDEVLDLLFYVTEERYWPKLVEYYKQKNPLVPLNVILRYCSYDFDLEKEAAVERFLKLAELLKNEGIFDKDIIEFHEEDNKFHWNEESLTF